MIIIFKCFYSVKLVKDIYSTTQLRKPTSHSCLEKKGFSLLEITRN